MPSRLQDKSLDLDKDPLQGKAGTPVSGEGEEGPGQESPTPPGDIPQNQDKKKVSWIEIELVDDNKQPIAGEPYQITLPDGTTVREGVLDHAGFARVVGIDPGSCKVNFPALDAREWRRAS